MLKPCAGSQHSLPAVQRNAAHLTAIPFPEIITEEIEDFPEIKLLSGNTIISL